MPETSAKTKVGLVQINNSFSGQNYLPLSAGLLQAYVERYLKRPEDFEFLLPLYRRCRVEEAAERLQEADIIFFSTYVWDIRLSLEIARVVKERRPETVVAFGGPQVPDRAVDFLRANPFVDLACHNEGERVALSILENLASRHWEAVPSVSYLNGDGAVVDRPRLSRMNDLSSIPSPYLAGVFGSLMQANPEEKWIALWETNRGCPFSCTFCDWGSAVQSKVYPFEMERLFGEIEWFADHRIEFLFCCDANFGILPRDVDIASRVAEMKQRYGYPNAFSVQNTKNVTDRAYRIQKILSDAGLNKGVAIALQSMDPTTLKSIKRHNISTEFYQELQRRFTLDRVETYSDTILGLPGETYDTFVNGVSAIMSNGQHNRIQFNNLSILPNAEMGDPEYQKKYGMVTVETKIINVHGTREEMDGDIAETQTLVIATDSMPRKDWVRTRSFAWMAALLHFDKLFQIPFILLHEICSVGYRELIEIFSEGTHEPYPILSEMKTFLGDKARDIQGGGPEYCHSEAWLNMWWPADEYLLIKLCSEEKLDRFYEEALKVLSEYLESKFMSLPPRLLEEAVALNRGLLKKPFQTQDLTLDLSYNLWEFYQAVLHGLPIPLEERSSRYHIDRTVKVWTSWQEWCQEVVWYGHRRGAYLYGNNSIETELAGHY